ncbi:MAG: pyridoxal-phosphate dependent enzyme [Chloroflexi bacterium]|nr:pyridoxal-phosphate dependent enzyme [Chloroflexota bacterium]
MNHQTVQIVCARCGQPAGPLDWRCATCGGPLFFADLPVFKPRFIRHEDWSLWRYADVLPAARQVSLGEGGTPLTPVRLPDGVVWMKLEYLNPTGSYKDRGTVTLVNHLLALGVGDAVEDSSGNAGASLAAYAGASGIRARIFVPESAPAGKKRLIALNAELVEVDGPRSAPTAACHEAARTSVYASHAWSPFFLAGQMTCAWEIWEQMGGRAPDAILCPVGHGGLFLGLALGFERLRDAGLIERLPRLYAVQSAACDPVVRAWEAGLDEPLPAPEGHTVADGIVVNQPVRGREILAAIRESGGLALRVDDAATLAAQALLVRHGLLAEPTSAVPVAALPTARAHAGLGATIVVPLTGSGLKTLTH